MDIKYDYITGSINEVAESLIRSVGQYISYYSKVKVGITNNPERRKRDHERSRTKWNKMVVKYKTSSVNYINRMEKIIIESHWDFIENKVGGGGGPDGEGPYYLYVLLKWEMNDYKIVEKLYEIRLSHKKVLH